MASRSFRSHFIALVLLVLGTTVFASTADYYLKIEGVKGERARLIHCPDGTCPVEVQSSGKLTITVCDSHGNPLPDNYKVTVMFNPKEYKVAEESSTTVTKGTMTGVMPGTSEVRAPRDAASGQATGKRQHKPITIAKEMDKNSPKLEFTTPTGGDNESVIKWALEIRVDKIEMK